MSDALFEMDEPSHDETPKTHACTGAFCQVCNPGLALKQRGMKQALRPDALAEWKDEFRAYIQSMPHDSEFTSEDVVDAVGLPSGDVRMNANNAVGAMMNGLARRGLIAKTGVRVQSKRPSSHGAELILWVRRARPSTMETHDRSNRPVPVPSPDGTYPGSAFCPDCGSASHHRVYCRWF